MANTSIVDNVVLYIHVFSATANRQFEGSLLEKRPADPAGGGFTHSLHPGRFEARHDLTTWRLSFFFPFSIG